MTTLITEARASYSEDVTEQDLGNGFSKFTLFEGQARTWVWGPLPLGFGFARDPIIGLASFSGADLSAIQLGGISYRSSQIYSADQGFAGDLLKPGADPIFSNGPLAVHHYSFADEGGGRISYSLSEGADYIVGPYVTWKSTAVSGYVFSMAVSFTAPNGFDTTGLHLFAGATIDYPNLFPYVPPPPDPPTPPTPLQLTMPRAGYLLASMDLVGTT